MTKECHPVSRQSSGQSAGTLTMGLLRQQCLTSGTAIMLSARSTTLHERCWLLSHTVIHVAQVGQQVRPSGVPAESLAR